MRAPFSFSLGLGLRSPFERGRRGGAATGITNIVAPVISGSSFVGNVLNVTDNGTWSPVPAGYGYQWYRDAAQIPGATASSHTTTSADLAATIRCLVVPSGGSGAFSNGIAVALAPAWVPLSPLGEAPLLADDLAGDAGWFDGTEYESEADLLTAVGGSLVSGSRVIGPYLDPGAASVLVNGTFDADVTGWTGQNGGTPSWDSGEMALTASGTANARAYRDVSVTSGVAYRLDGTHRRGTSYSNHQLAVSTTGFGTTVASTVAATTGTVTDGVVFGASASTMYVAAVAPTGSPGTLIFDDMSVKTVTPVDGYVAGEGLYRISARTGPSLPAAIETVFEADDGTTRNAIRLDRLTGGELILNVSFGNVAQIGTSVGSVPNDTDFVAWLSIKNNACQILLDGGNIWTDTSCTVPGVGYFRTGKSASGNTWTGSLYSFAYWPNSATLSADPNASFDVVGDSMPITGATSALPFYRSLPAAYSPTRAMTADAVGGRNSTDMRTVAIAHTTAQKAAVGVIFDCYNTGEDVATYIQNIKDIAASRTGRFIVLSQPFKTDGTESSGAVFDAKTAIDSALSAFFPSANWLDIGSATLARSDGLHLSDAGHTELTARVKAKMDANGW